MVQVRDDYPLDENGKVDIARWVARLHLPDAGNLEQVRQSLIEAAEFSATYDNSREQASEFWGEDYSRFLTGLEMAEILTDLSLDEKTLVAAIIYRSVRDGVVSLEEVEAKFSKEVKTLVEGVLQMAAIASSEAYLEQKKVLGSNQAQPDHVRKMLVAMVDDVRVALIKLSERTCAIRAVKNNEQRRYKVAKEVFEVYAPLAHRLGIGHIKWELEDLSFRYLEPDSYKRIAKQLDERRLDRQQFIDDVIARLEQELKDANIEGEVFGRAKHIYSIWRKMQRKKIDFSEVYDIRAVRILVKQPRDCYTVLGIIHTLWKAIPNEFDDYIALPKENGYRSLHTAVIGPDAKVLEIQIRTYTMHEEAEFGVCAHWQYKGADAAKRSEGYEEKIAWLKQVLDEQENEDMPHLVEELGHEVTQDRIYVFTPNGHVVELTSGATPLDFAYRVHTEIGHRCRGAKINGRIVPLTYHLENGQQVEILTAKEPEPSREWLRPSLGYLNTNRARAKVRSWFKQQDRSKNISTGKALLEREFKRLSMTSLDFKAVATELNFETVDDMYATVGAGDMGTGQVLRAAQNVAGVSTNQYELSPSWLEQRKAQVEHAKEHIHVTGAGNMLTTMAKCCKPLPGDSIGGYVTVGRGVSVHRKDCPEFLLLQEKERERIIEVNFDSAAGDTYPVDIAIEAYDRPGLLSDITVMLANEKVNVLAVKTYTDQANNMADMQLTILVKGIEYLSRLLAKINQLPNVISVSRVVDNSLLK
jgi:GTP pyrophosphokinase